MLYEGILTMPQIIGTKNIYKFLSSLVIPFLIIILKPLDMNINQSIVLASLFLTITWWATGYVTREAASIFMILMFLVFGQTPIEKVMFFPLSKEFIIIIASFLLSAGIVNSKIADRFSKFFLYKFCKTSKSLVVMSFILGIVFVFIIPQPFPRVIILSSIYITFLMKEEIPDEERKVILFSVFVASTVTSTIFLNGDIILNYAALKFGDISMTQLEWIKNMSIPSLFTSVVILGLFLLIFRQDLDTVFTLPNKSYVKMEAMEKKVLIIMISVVILWLTETIHGISASYTAILGVIAMMIFGIITSKDLKSINFKLLIFLTATFSIGKVLTYSGVAIILSEFMTKFFPNETNVIYIPFIILLIMIIHMLFGSTVTTLSVLIPSLIGITDKALSPVFIVLLSYIVVSIQYLLPFHHVTIMIGYGNGYFENKHTLKFGFCMTIMVFIIVFLIYIPWWRLVGLL